MANIFVNDPLLGGGSNYSNQMEELARMQRELEQRKQLISQQAMPTQHVSRSPIWDEIESLTESMSDREMGYITQSNEYKHSEQEIAGIINREYMRMMRPVVEGTEDGKRALESHLALIRRLKKEAAKTIERNIDLFNEYTEHYPDMTYADFLKMKRKEKKS